VIAKLEFTLSRVLLERQRAAMTYYDRDVRCESAFRDFWKKIISIRRPHFDAGLKQN